MSTLPGWMLSQRSGSRCWPVRAREAMQMLHVYAKLAAAGEAVTQRYPGIAAHLQACGPCGEDFEGLLAAIRDEAQ